MSLTTELRAGPLADWCARAFPGVDALAAQISARLAGVARVAAPAGARGGAHHALVGGAFGQRLAFAVEAAPPYYALLGAFNAGLVDWVTAGRAAASFPTHAAVRADPTARRAAHPLWARPSPGGWLDITPERASWPHTGAPASHPRTVSALVARVAALLDGPAQPGRFAERPEVEAELGGCCAVLSGWEEAYRSGRLDAATARLYRTTPDGDGRAVPALLARAPAAVTADLVALTSHARRAGLLERLAALAGHPSPGAPLGHAGPVFVPDWADGDLLLTHPDPGHGSTLLDVKTVTHTDDPSRIRSWLWQLLGYALVDALGGDDWHIRHVGLLFARHALVLTWPLAQLLPILTATPATDLQPLLGGFHQALNAALARHGASITQT